jgi:hypothetical protein
MLGNSPLIVMVIDRERVSPGPFTSYFHTTPIDM